MTNSTTADAAADALVTLAQPLAPHFERLAGYRRQPEVAAVYWPLLLEFPGAALLKIDKVGGLMQVARDLFPDHPAFVRTDPGLYTRALPPPLELFMAVAYRLDQKRSGIGRAWLEALVAEVATWPLPLLPPDGKRFLKALGDKPAELRKLLDGTIGGAARLDDTVPRMGGTMSRTARARQQRAVTEARERAAGFREE